LSNQVHDSFITRSNFQTYRSYRNRFPLSDYNNIVPIQQRIMPVTTRQKRSSLSSESSSGKTKKKKIKTAQARGDVITSSQSYNSDDTITKGKVGTTSSTTKKGRGTAKKKCPEIFNSNKVEIDVVSHNNHIISQDKPLSDHIIQRMNQISNPQTKAWFTNYVKGTQWIGCKTPQVKQIVKDVMKCYRDTDHRISGSNGQDSQPERSEQLASLSSSTFYLYEESIKLIKHEACDVKSAGMILLSEYIPLQEIATISVLDHLEDELFYKILPLSMIGHPPIGFRYVSYNPLPITKIRIIVVVIMTCKHGH
jgi:hypothetical protein